MAYPLNHFASSAIKDLTPQMTILAPLDDSQSENRAPLNPIFDGAALLSSPGVLHLPPSCGCATTRLASPPPLQSTPLHPHPGLPSPRDPPLCVLGDDLLCDSGAPSFADFQRFLLTSLQSQSTLEVFPNDTPAGILSSALLAQCSPPGFSTIAYGRAFTTLVGHTQCVSSVVWPQRETIYSASWDHSIRRWDVETGKDSLSMSCGKVINCLDIGGESSALIAAGGSDPVLRIWDPRKPGTLSPIFQFSSHNSWISSCKWHHKSWFHLVSASYDGKVMLWDLRTAWPLTIMDSHKDKVLCSDWWKDDSVVSGGVDSKLCISSGISVL